MLLTVLLVIVIGLGLYVLTVYNGLVTNRVRIKAAIQEIGNQLKRQADLIPNLEQSAHAYLKHEKAIFDKLTSARKAVEAAVKSGDLKQMSQADDKVQALVGGLRVILESNPEMKGADVIGQLMEELRDTADKVMYSRRTLIDLTADYNTQLSTFPSNLIDTAFQFTPEAGLETPTGGDFLKVASEETKTPRVKLE